VPLGLRTLIDTAMNYGWSDLQDGWLFQKASYASAKAEHHSWEFQVGASRMPRR
jgi:hypothetical protein